jgi:hypothetical protein
VNRFTAPLVVVALSGCTLSNGTNFEDYYGNDRQDPVISDVSPPSEPGNIGGQTISIVGSGFGDSADVVVLIGNHNAEIVSVSDGEIRVKTPRGPITGGPVDIVVATENGWTELADRYEYDVTEDVDVYDGQTGYIAVQNLWTSCYGGQWENPDLQGAGCDQSVWIGYSGTQATSEWYEAPYPRIHLSEYELVSGTDYAPGSWYFDAAFESNFPSGVDDLRFRPLTDSAPAFKLINPLWTEEAQRDVDTCAYGGDPDDPRCVAEYDLSEMNFCEGVDPVEGGDFRYVGDWPVQQNFFNANPSEPDARESQFSPVDVYLQVPAQGLNGNAVSSTGTRLRIPGALDIEADRGIGDPATWTLQALSSCLDADDDGQALLDEEGVVFSWTPIADDLAQESDGVESVHSWVHVSVSILPFGWFGRTSSGPRASIVVPDDNLIDPETGRASVAIPNWVFYSFPTIDLNWGGYNDFTKKGDLGSYENNAGYMLIEVFRVTDYRLETESGPIVFSYETGDFSIQEWTHPLDRAGCSNCFDDDGDGWADDSDPDCNTDVGGNGTDEGNATSTFTCNDGRDNNGDGLIDAADPLCAKGWDGETTCGDGIDNDADGWTDDLDPGCAEADASEDDGYDSALGCNNGLDDDGDGWVDVGDPGCATASDPEDDGLSGTACNDGVDNDGHGDADALDPYCAEQGGLATEEAPTFTSRCVDDDDNDDDGYVDGQDPDCEYVKLNEFQMFAEAGSEVLIPTCYDGLDNDDDGAIDAADTTCWSAALGYLPDGFLDENAAGGTTSCNDGADDDADGWLDGEDPDCVPGDPAMQTETGFISGVACNDGIDNNGDGLVDRESSYCKSAKGTFEGP